MPSSRRRPKHFGIQSWELAWAVPQVMAIRLTRMALAGSSPTPRDQREFQRMSAEKIAAFYESWNAMFAELFRAQCEWSFAALRSMWLLGTIGEFPSIATSNHSQRIAHDILRHGMAPIHRAALANMKRLQRG